MQNHDYRTPTSRRLGVRYKISIAMRTLEELNVGAGYNAFQKRIPKKASCKMAEVASQSVG
jgi:hypothetical protein